jgi:uncharacterized membrane protein
MMWWNGFGWGWGLVILGMLMCVAMMAMMMSHGSSRRAREPGETTVDAPERADAPERILAKRLASGEIDVEEYQRLRDTLQRTGNATPDAADPNHADRDSPTA